AGIGVPAGAGEVDSAAGAGAGASNEAAARGGASGTGIDIGRSSAATAGSDIANEVSMPGRGCGVLGFGSELRDGGSELRDGGAPPRSKSGSAGGRFAVPSNGRSTTISDSTDSTGARSATKPRSNGASGTRIDAGGGGA